MLLSQINIGKKIYISLKRIDDIIEQNYELPSQIVDIVDESLIVISSPFYKSNIISLEIGDELTITFTHENGLYMFEGKTIELVDEEGIILYVVKVTSDIQRLQRRENFRVPINVPIVYQYFLNTNELYGQGMVKDISGGGLKFICSDELKEGIKLDIFARLSNDFELKTCAKVIRCCFIEQSKYEISLTFEGLTFGRKENIIRFMFGLQRDNLKNNR